MREHEEHDSFELIEGEKIEGLTFWLSKEGYSSEIRKLAQGKIVAVRIDTSHRRGKIFESHGTHSPQFDCMQHQYQSNLHEEMVS
jgi:hypothetical protein